MDGVSDGSDDFPNDPNEQYDSDSDGIGNNSDIFPNDPAASVDTDGDGYPDQWNAGKTQADSTTSLSLDWAPSDSSEWVDSDGDGVGDNADAFPDDPSETVDSDDDGVGDNGDAFPQDSAAALDSDDDGYPDRWNPGKSQTDSTTSLTIDAFPNDAAEWLDSDFDGVGDNADLFDDDPYEWTDSDGDGVGDNGDAAPHDPNRYANQDPSIDGVADREIEAGETVVIELTFSDPDNDPVSLTLIDAPDFVTLEGSILTIAPDAATTGEFKIIIKISDDFGGYNYLVIAIAVADTANTYSDVPDTHVASDAIVALATQGVIEGCDATHFCPEQLLDRATLARWMLRAVEGGSYSPPPATGQVYDDVDAADFNADWIETLANRDLTQGCNAAGSRFCPGQSIPRAALSALLLKARYGSAYNPAPALGTVFDDIAASDFHAAWIEDLWFQGITNGCDANRFCPHQLATRAEAARWLYRAFGP